MIRPIAGNHGVGFFAMESLPQYAGSYSESNAGRYWNYHVTPANWQWPETYKWNTRLVIDGFSPNLNKKLHVGHLRQLALANCFEKMMPQTQTKMVALLGASLGVYKYATDALKEWFEFLNYHPEIHYDVLSPLDPDVVVRKKVKMPVKDPIARDFNGNPFEYQEECQVWDGPQGPVIVVRHDGRPTYAFHDVAFAKTVGPTHYVTGVEQKEHFEKLGLQDRHLPMGLVLGTDGKKMKSRAGDVFTAEDVIVEISGLIKPVFDGLQRPDNVKQKKLAWNVACWNFLATARPKDVKFDADNWTRIESPGMYVTYTYARMKKALKEVTWAHIPPANMEKIAELHGGAPNHEINQDDANILGYSDYYHYYLNRSRTAMDPAELAHFAHGLARVLGKAYHAEKIVGGRVGFQYAVAYATEQLGKTMDQLGMFRLEEI